MKIQLLVKKIFYSSCCTLFFLMVQSSEASQTKLTLVLDWFANPDHAPLFVAQQQGFFKQQGIDVQFIAPADPTDPPKLVSAGKADLALTYQPHFIVQVKQGLPLARIATLIETPLNCLAVKASSSIHTLDDLKGKRIGYSGGATDISILKIMLANAHLTIKDVDLINVHFNLAQALLSGKVDAVIGMMRNFEPTQLAILNQPVRVFYPEEHGVPLYDELIIITHKNHLHDPSILKFLTALELGTHYLLNHTEETWQQFAKDHPDLNNELNRRAWFDTLPRFALRPAANDLARHKRLECSLFPCEGVVK